MKKLKKAYIEITNVCNLSCAFCPGTSRKPGFMSAPEFETVLRKLHGFTDHVYLHVMGEPLLHPDLEKLLELCRLYGYKVNITTNGTLIKYKSGILHGAPALRQVNFSVHSHEDVDDDETDRRTADYYLANIFSYTEEALDKGRVYISYRLWNLTSKASEQYNAYVVQKLQQKFKPDFSISEALASLKRITIRDRLFLNSAEVFQWPSGSKGNKGTNSSGANSSGANSSGAGSTGVSNTGPGSIDDRGFCLGLRNQVAILVDGTVVPCCLDGDGGIQLGNIFGMDFAAIMEGDRARALYDGFSQRRAVEELCRKCSYRNRFSTGTST